MDVSEEFERLEMHIDAMQEILAQGGLVGRRLDFFNPRNE